MEEKAGQMVLDEDTRLAADPETAAGMTFQVMG